VRIFANDGAGRFSDVTADAIGPADIPGTSIAIEIADFDGDGRPDIFIGQLAGQGGSDAQDRLLLNARS